MFTKEEIYKDIQKIMKEDYAGYIDSQHLNHPDRYTITNDMTDQEFEETIEDYLLDFNDGHLGFAAKNTEMLYIGFSVRRYEDALYVTNAAKEKRLIIGDEITQIDGVGILELATIYGQRLEDEIPERQRWSNILSQAKTARIKRGEITFDLLLANYERTFYEPTYTFKKLNDETVYIKLTDFLQEAPIRKLVQENKTLLEQSKNLIIDVRVNNGGNDSFYFPLLQYLFDKKMTLTEMFAEDEVMYTNYTNRNCDLWIEAMQSYLEQDLDPEVAATIKDEIDKSEEHRGKGFVEVTEEIDFVIEGGSIPEQVYLLSDCYCGSSGDTFVANAKKSSKVTVVGRPTMGIIDYCNVATEDYEKYEFMYSISKMNEKYFVNETGVLPDIYIPWTPEHLKEDKDLAYVLDLIKSDL